MLGLAVAEYFIVSGRESVRAAPVPPVASEIGASAGVSLVPAFGEAFEGGPLAPGALVIPVAGIDRTELRDTWGASRGRGRQHHAIDILAPRGTPALAAVDGVVLKLFESDAGGRTVYLADRKRRYLYYYAHLDSYADGLTEGARVEGGTVVGYVGTSGNAPSDAPHLHFSVERLPPGGEWWKGIPENPYPVLMERGITLQK